VSAGTPDAVAFERLEPHSTRFPEGQSIDHVANFSRQIQEAKRLLNLARRECKILRESALHITIEVHGRLRNTTG